MVICYYFLTFFTPFRFFADCIQDQSISLPGKPTQPVFPRFSSNWHFPFRPFTVGLILLPFPSTYSCHDFPLSFIDEYWSKTENFFSSPSASRLTVFQVLI